MLTNKQKGFTLVELMITLAIIGVLGAAATLSIDPGKSSKSARGFAEEIASRINVARERAIASQKQQWIDIYDVGLSHFEAIDEGLDTDVAWNDTNPVYELSVNQNLRISAVEDVDGSSVTETRLQAGGTILADGTNLPYRLVMLPNGKVRDGTDYYYGYLADYSITIFVQHRTPAEIERGDIGQRARILVFGMTGTTLVLDEW